MIKISVCGVQGNGKTTLCKKLVDLFKKYNKNVYFVTESARTCPYPINENATIRSERWIWTEHQRRELEAHSSGADIIVCDRTLMDNMCYYKLALERQGMDDRIFDDLVKMTKIWMKTYDYIILLPINKEYIVDDGVRSDNIEFANSIDELMYKYIGPYANVSPYKFNYIDFAKEVIKEL